MPEQIRLPQSGGGLVRYFDEYKSKLKVSPFMVIILIIIIIIIEFFLHKSNLF